MGSLIPLLSGTAPRGCTAVQLLWHHMCWSHTAVGVCLYGEQGGHSFTVNNPYCSKSCLFLAVSVQMRGVFAQFKESLFFPGDKHLNHSGTHQTSQCWRRQFPRLGSTWPPKAWAWGLPLQIRTTPSLDGLSGARPGASAYFPLGALPIKPLLTREFKTTCRITFVCSWDRGSCICADLVPVSCLSLSCLSLPVSFSSGGPGTRARTPRLPRPLVPSQAGDVPRGCSVPLPCVGPARLGVAVSPRAPAALYAEDRRIDGASPAKP